jgi:hypothetical protein
MSFVAFLFFFLRALRVNLFPSPLKDPLCPQLPPPTDAAAHPSATLAVSTARSLTNKIHSFLVVFKGKRITIFARSRECFSSDRHTNTQVTRQSE